PGAPTNVVTFARGLSAPATIEVSPDGSLLVLNRGTLWRDGKKFATNSGSLVRIRYTGLAPEMTRGRDSRAPLPRALDATGIFASLSPLTPHNNFTEFQINLTPWQPGVTVRRWISIPPGGKLLVSSESE